MKQVAYLVLMILPLATFLVDRPALAQNEVRETHGKIFLDEDFSKSQANQAPAGWVVSTPNPALAPVFQVVDFPDSRSGKDRLKPKTQAASALINNLTPLSRISSFARIDQ